MNADVIQPLLRIKKLRADRAEDEHRLQVARYNAALAEVETANRTLAEWRSDMPCKEAAIYDEIIGRLVDLDALDAVRQQVVQLREHERLLQQRLLDQQEAARAAGKVADEAAATAARARRDVSKFEEVVHTLQLASLAEAERREDLELEEFARASGAWDADEDSGDKDEWGYAA